MRLIDADALIGKLHEVYFFDGDDRETVYKVIQEQSTILPLVDTVPVVHCKDCKYGWEAPGTQFVLCQKPYSGSPLYDINYYCADGERK